MNKLRPLLVGGLVLIGLARLGCANESAPEQAPKIRSLAAHPHSEATVMTGADVLVSGNLAPLVGKRVGLIANHTARVDSLHLSDVLARMSGVELVALFGPEHGVRGTIEAGEEVRDGRDVRTGVPLFSLYGATRKPTPEMLDGIDVLAFDVQDVGARFYTYISTLGLAMQAAAEAGVSFLVLDRPNPLGGEYVSGFVMEPEEESFVGLYPIPIAHGLTVGELARMIQGEGMLEGLESLDLEVIAMEGWKRSMLWQETGLPWIAPSPNIPSFESALVYPGTCLFEALNASEGRGTEEPFLQVGAPYADGAAMAEALNGRDLPGASFESVSFAPRPIEQMASQPRFRGESLEGVRIRVEDPEAYLPVETGIHIIDLFRRQASEAGAPIVERIDWLARLSGTRVLGEMLETGTSPEAIIQNWQADVEAFRTARRPYLLYE